MLTARKFIVLMEAKVDAVFNFLFFNKQDMGQEKQAKEYAPIILQFISNNQDVNIISIEFCYDLCNFAQAMFIDSLILP